MKRSHILTGTWGITTLVQIKTDSLQKHV